MLVNKFIYLSYNSYNNKFKGGKIMNIIKDNAKGYFNLFINNPKRLDLFLMYRNLNRLDENITKQAVLDKQQENDLTK